MSKKPTGEDCRTISQLREHYEIEKELACRLRTAPKHERCILYSCLYDELFRRIPHHPQMARKLSSLQTMREVDFQMSFLQPFLNQNFSFLEIGPGDCALSLRVAKYVKQVYAVDVSDEISKILNYPNNFRLILSDGISIPVQTDSVNVAYSNQLMEHLHPDDALEQLKNIYNVLTPGGNYICITPNKLNGPHDISKHFDKIATCLHLKEYTTFQLEYLFKKVGFSKVRAFVGARGKFFGIPVFLIKWCEKFLIRFPFPLRKIISENLPIRWLLGIRLVGYKKPV